MPTHCSALNCKNRDTPECRRSGITFHRLPTDLGKKLEWCRHIGRTDNDGSLWVPKSKSYLCSKHFESSLFRMKGTRKLLRKASVPTKFCVSSNDMKKKWNANAEVSSFFLIDDTKPNIGLIKKKLRPSQCLKYYFSDDDSAESPVKDEVPLKQRDPDFIPNLTLLESIEKIEGESAGKELSLVDSEVDSNSDYDESEYMNPTFESKNHAKKFRSNLVETSNVVIPSDYVKVEVKEEEFDSEHNFHVEFSSKFLQNEEEPFPGNKIKINLLLKSIDKSRRELEDLEVKSLNLNSQIEAIKKVILRNIQ